MNIGSIGGGSGILGLYNTMAQGSMALMSRKLSRQYSLPENKARGTDLFGEGALNYIANAKSGADKLKSSVNALSGGSVFNKRTMVSSNPDAITVNTSGNNLATANPINVKVLQTASGQVNEGGQMRSTATFGDAGDKAFTIESGGQTATLNVNVSSTDTYKDVQKKMADAINGAGVGVRAAVITDSKTGMSRLRIESNKTGDDDESRFTVVDNSGYLASQMGVDNVTTDARDAVYTVNGQERTAKTNTVNLGSGVNVTFKQATDEAVRIAPGRNADAAKQAVEKMVSDFNNLRDEAAKMAQSDPKAANLVSKLSGVAKQYSRSLSNIGINVANDGSMSIDTAKLSEAADSGKLEQFFREGSGANYGFASQLSKVADSVMRNPSSYISSPQYRNSVTENFGYGSGGNLITYDFLSSGLMYDYSF